MSLVKYIRGIFFISVLALPLVVQAGRSCEEKPLSATVFRQAMQTAEQVKQKLDEVDSDVVLLGRVGQDLSKYNMRYSHAGFVYRTEKGGRWRVAHLLNDCGTAQSDLWFEGLGNFFLDDMFSFESVVVVPPPAVATKLKQRLQDNQALRSVFNPQYSMTAYPFSTKYANSNSWLLETLAATLSQESTIRTREQAQSWLKLQGYQPATLTIRALSRLGGRMFKANVMFDDHPSEQRYSNRIQTASVESIIQFVQSRHEGWQVMTLAPPR